MNERPPRAVFTDPDRSVTELKGDAHSGTGPHESAQQLRAVLDTAVDGIILIDALGNILIFNPACEKLFGYQQNEVVGRNVKMLMPAPFHQGHDRYLEDYQRSGERKVIGIGREVEGRGDVGAPFPVEMTVDGAMYVCTKALVD